MGTCQSQEEKMMANQSSTAQQNTIKLLLLGPGECGKSTILKQMRLLHTSGFTDEEINQQKTVIYNNIVQGMASILRGMKKFDIPFENPDRTVDARIVIDTFKSYIESEPLTPTLIAALKKLWADKQVRKNVHERGSEFHIAESTAYFLDSIDRISLPDYKPTQKDILLSRIKTTGIVEVKFKIKNVNFRIFDVGGQRSERKKWIHCFEDVNAVIFIAAISQYDQVLFEDENTNSMIESIRLFESICNSRWFINTAIILFLNKKDLFAEKIKRVSIKIAFPEYDGPQTYDDSVLFIEKKFEAVNANLEKTIYTHQTCATDTNQVQIILDSVIDTIIQANLRGCGLY
ncbi:unnamed protein product [Cercopithifilaria johnstoni]|uniref:Uncharacterized protein n=1 Tax=Cercopithifilaria johnstoni TaxID=2874296 RepID=A0A8J2MDT1_9BILA|nr:unnamed protein product [Cercopithifilaria johnstoni]